MARHHKLLIHGYFIVSLAALLIMGGLFVLPQDTRSAGKINVLVDLSHEFTFLYDIFGLSDTYLNPAEFQKTTSHATLTSSAVNLNNYDVVIIAHYENNIFYDDAEIQLLDNWVRAGGGLLLAGDGIADYPLNKLANKFGINFTTTLASRPFSFAAHDTTSGVGQFEIFSASFATILDVTGDFQPILYDNQNRIIGVSKNVGQGFVAAIGDRDFISNPYVEPTVRNKIFAINLIAWLGRNNRSQSTAIPTRLLPEQQVTASGATVYYTSKTAGSPFATVVNESLGRINQELERISGISNVRTMTFVVLAGGGGYGGGSEVGVGSDLPKADAFLVLAHELMHSYDSPNAPPEMMHPVVSWVADKVGIAVGGEYEQLARREITDWDAAFKQVDPTGRTLDVTNYDIFDRRGKMFWIMSSLDGTYGFNKTGLYNFPTAHDPINFVKRFYQLKRADTAYQSTPKRIVELLSMAACKNLYQDFINVGTTLPAPDPTLDQQITTACADAPPADTTPPTINIISPVNADAYSTSINKIIISATITDNVSSAAGITATWENSANSNTGSATASGNTWTAANITLVAGVNTITFTAKDQAGNTGTDSILITYTPPDTTPPAVSLSSSSLGPFTSSGSATLTATASDNVGVSRVEFYDGASLKATDTATPYTYLWSFTSLDNGTHSWTAKAYDAAGNTTTSNIISLAVSIDSTSPTISISAPASGSTVSGSAVTISANASDNIGVQFKIDSANYGTEDTSSPYAISWNTLSYSNGIHSITAVARDAAGNQTTATTISVTVSNDTTAPVISSVAASGITTSGATISWATDELSDSQIDYGLTVSYGLQTTLNSTLVTSHSQSLSGLSANTLYHYRVRSRDAAGNLALSSNQTFTTSPPLPEEASNPNPPDGDSNITVRPTLTWIAGQYATAHDLYFGYTNPPPLRASQLPSALYQLPELAKGTTYYWRIAEWNAFGITAGPVWSFTTVGAVTLPPPAKIPKEKVIFIGRFLTIGSRGDDVLKLQIHLQLLGYFPTNETPTGYYGAITKNSIEKYQCAILTVCSGSPTINGYGTVGPRTRAALAGTSPPKAPAQGSGITITRYLTLGFYGEDVRQLQVYLQQLGHLPKNISPTGYYGRITEDAVKKFQCQVVNLCSGSSGVNGYGAVGPRTRGALAQ